MESDAYYDTVRRAYDGLAATYDDTVGRALVSRRAKDLAVECIASVTPPRGLLLDVGCYTGGESLRLAQMGFRVVGVDLSPLMIERSRAKAIRWHLEDRTRFEVALASDLTRIAQPGDAAFDTAYSVYGTLNLEPRIDGFKRTLLPLLKPRGFLVVGLLNPVVLYELLFGPFGLEFGGYRKLGRKHVQISVGGGALRLEGCLYTPRGFAALLAPEFSPVVRLGVHFLYPPPKAATPGGGWWAARALDAAERKLQGSRPFSDCGLFSLMVFQKR